MEDKYVWPVIIVSMILLGAAIGVVVWYEFQDTWEKIDCNGLDVWTNFQGKLGAKYFPDQRRVMVWDEERPEGRYVQIRDFIKVAGKLPAHVVIDGDGYTYGVIVKTATPTFRIPHFSYANITVVDAVEEWGAAVGGNVTIYVAHILTDVKLNISVEADKWVDTPGVFVYTDASRTVELNNYSYSGIVHNESVEISLSLSAGTKYLTMKGNNTDFSWRLFGNSSFNIKTWSDMVPKTTKSGYCYMRTWVNATSNYSAMQLTIAVPMNGTHHNELVSVLEGLANITANGAKCWINEGIVVINCSAINYGISRTYYLKTYYLNNTAPRITSSPDTTAGTSVVWSYQITATDPDPDVFTYYLVHGTGDMEINQTTGVVRWNPDYEGSYHITVAVSDGLVNTTQSFTLTIKDSNWERLADGFWSYLMTPAAILLIVLTVGKWALWDRLKNSETVKEFTEDTKKVP